MKAKGKVLVAMSGGIDSSVAALMLHNEGYEVIGITMKTWDYAAAGGSKKETGCCSLDSINDARTLAVNLGFPHYILDIRAEFGEHIINNFVEEYLAGRTPNPCVLCNTHIKWDALLKRADQLECDFIATGHYAKVRLENGRYVISKGVDESKDQSYVLWGLSQESLKRTMFPLGNYKKSEIREMAMKAGYAELAGKSESYEICFIPENDYRAFLKHKVPGLEEKVEGGDFVFTNGEIVGKHRGYPFYTVGQRKRIEVAFGEPMFVIQIIPETNTVVIGTKVELDRQEMIIRDFNLVKYETLPLDFVAHTKIRYHDSGAPAALAVVNDKIKVLFQRPVVGVAPGQSAVFYEGDDLVGGGFIARNEFNINEKTIPFQATLPQI